MATSTLERSTTERSQLPVLSAKICPEVLPAHAVARPRLLDLLARRPWRIASITAGAGFGKSVLLLQWFATLEPGGCAVVALDEADNAPERFWRYVVASLQHARPGAFERTAQACGAPGGAEGLIAELLDEANALDGDLVLALEDLHTIRNKSVLATLARLLEHLPPALRVVFTSRQDVALPLPRWRARSWLVDVREADLAFTANETAQLFAALNENRLSSGEIERLTQVTEGWVTARQLAALAMLDSDPHQVVEGFCGRNRMVADFLGAEIIDRQTDDMREFMTAIAVADSFDPELCNLLTGRQDSVERLDELAAAMHFLVAVDDAGETYRYHHLLRDVLRADLARRHPDRYAQLHGLVAEVFERRGEFAAAAVHRIEGGDFDRAFRALFGSAHDLWERGDIETVTMQLRVFPIEYIEASPRRMLVYAHALSLCSRFDESREWLERAEKALHHDAAAAPEDHTMLDAMRVIAFNADGRGADGLERGRRALTQVEAGSDVGMLGRDLRQHLARAELLADDAPAARATLSARVAATSAVQAVRALGLSALIAGREGSLKVAAEQARRAITAAVAFDIPDHVVTVDAHLATLSLLVDRNEIAATAEPLAELNLLLERSPAFTSRVLIHIEEVRLVAARDGIDPALDLLREVGSLVDPVERPKLSERIVALEARLQLEAGELKRTTRLLERLPTDSLTRRLLDARWLLASDRPRDAIRLIGAGQFTQPRASVEAQVILVRASVMVGADPDPALRRLVDVAAPERFVRAVLDEGPVVARLVRRWAEASDTVEAERFAVELGAPRRRLSASSELIDPLSARERDVLRFLPSRLTSKEIAAECYMSVNTVKAHLKRIYRKLGVSTRAEAVERATMLGELHA
jgi:LuxR family transcriptional regulator, maltose regulon positive regulatory protein